MPKLAINSEIDYTDFLKKIQDSIKFSNLNEGLEYIGRKLSNFIKKYFKNNVQSFIYSISNNKKTIELNAFI